MWGIHPQHTAIVPPLVRFQRIWAHTLKVAALFWGAFLVLVAVETAVGSSTLLAFLFSLCIPALVGFLTWVNKDILWMIERRVLSVVVLGLTVLVSSSVIILVGLVAAVSLKTLMADI